MKASYKRIQHSDSRQSLGRLGLRWLHGRARIHKSLRVAKRRSVLNCRREKLVLRHSGVIQIQNRLKLIAITAVIIAGDRRQETERNLISRWLKDIAHMTYEILNRRSLSLLLSRFQICRMSSRMRLLTTIPAMSASSNCSLMQANS